MPPRPHHPQSHFRAPNQKGAKKQGATTTASATTTNPAGMKLLLALLVAPHITVLAYPHSAPTYPHSGGGSKKPVVPIKKVRALRVPAQPACGNNVTTTSSGPRSARTDVPIITPQQQSADPSAGQEAAPSTSCH